VKYLSLLDGIHFLIDLKTRAVASFSPDARTFHNIYKLQKHVLLKHQSKGEKWYDRLFNVKYLPLFHHFKAIYQFPKHIIFLIKIVANALLMKKDQIKDA
jgi:hypothetical protein